MNVCYDKNIAVLYFCIDDETLFSRYDPLGKPVVSELRSKQQTKPLAKRLLSRQTTAIL